MEKSYIEPLTKAGLSYSQSEVYEILLKNGPLKAGKIFEKSNLKRSLIYKELDELVKLGVIEKQEDKGKVAIFSPLHPSLLNNLVEKQQHKLKTAQLLLDGVLGQMASDFNLVSGMPGVQFYEGINGAVKVLHDSLHSQTEILTYIDNEAVSKYGKEINKAYVQKRHGAGIKKRMLTIDSEYIRSHAKTFNKELTKIRVIPQGNTFATVMQIYDNKVSYISIDQKQNIIGAIIQHPNIYSMHKTLFEALWLTAKEII